MQSIAHRDAHRSTGVEDYEPFARSAIIIMEALALKSAVSCLMLSTCLSAWAALCMRAAR